MGPACAIFLCRTKAIRIASSEEADCIRDLVAEILWAAPVGIDRDGQRRPVTLDDILIIAPYNAQVFELQERLPGARIGTVDKFQGQEAPVVIYSMTTSSWADAPRGMEFLYSLNRLNVATSRAVHPHSCRVAIRVRGAVPNAAANAAGQRLLPIYLELATLI